MKSLIISDNIAMLSAARKMASQARWSRVEWACSVKAEAECRAWAKRDEVRVVDVKREASRLAAEYGLILSLHCRQIFPPKLVRTTRCVNLHPGYNPYNRGWFPHVWGMMRGDPIGVTLHVMDGRVDHGAVIHRERVKVRLVETSDQVYQRLLNAELKVLRQWWPWLQIGKYRTERVGEGTFRTKKDFEHAKRLPLERRMTLGRALDYMKAMTFEGRRNAYVIDPQTRKKVYVTLKFESEDSIK